MSNLVYEAMPHPAYSSIPSTNPLMVSLDIQETEKNLQEWVLKQPNNCQLSFEQDPLCQDEWRS